MEATSPLLSLNGRNGPKELGEYRKLAIENATRQQFYQSDRVKQFHRELLLMETLNDRRLQMERNRRIDDNTNEETRRFMAEIRRGEMEALEQDRQRARQREANKRAYAEDLRRQMREMAKGRQQSSLAKQRERREREALREQHEQEQRQLRQRQRAEQLRVRGTYAAQVATSRGERDKQNRREALAEEWRQRCVREKDEWDRANEEKMAARLRRRQRRSQAASDMLAAQEGDRARQYEEAEARATAKALASREARASQERGRKQRTGLDMAAAIGAQREYKRRERQLREDEEKRSGLDELGFHRAADRAHWAGERRAARAQRDARADMDAALRQQMAQKRQQEALRRRAEMDLDARNQELLAHEDAQFRRYADGIIRVAEASKRNTAPVRRAANAGAGQGVGPIYGGLRAKYLVPGSSYIPDYVNSTAKDISRLYGAATDESSHGKLDFIW
ncbi:cilia- and flagella- associated protein 210-like [Anguilla rostrata]|uniref:cilia- and flagella- associated protein 210-like n=1 Tax=Anguilla rostrata TaxID=7938 RepID=UPI0030D06EDD